MSIFFLVLNSLVYANPLNYEPNLFSIEETIKLLELNFDDINFFSKSVITKTYALPFGSIIKDIEIQFFNIKEKLITNDATSRYPSKQEMSYNYYIGIGLENGQHFTFLTLNIYPIEYNPEKFLLRYAESTSIKINYELSIKEVIEEDSYDLVVIAPREFSNNIKKLVNHKEEIGIKTRLVTTQEIYDNFDGRDAQEKIKYFIKNEIEKSGIKYVLLFGGVKGQNILSWYVPVRYSHLRDGITSEESFISDLYYADIYKYDNQSGYTFDDWDSNKNGVFAEWDSEKKDILDLYPDVYVGRLPCRNVFEVRTVIDKIINYETTAYGKDWFKKMIVVGGDTCDDNDFNSSTNYIEGQIETEYALSFMNDFEKIRLWVEDGDVPLTTRNVGRAISKGAGFLYFNGHGSPVACGTHPYGDFKTWIFFRLFNIRFLSNMEKLPILIVSGCHCVKFDVSLLRIIEKNAFSDGYVTSKSWGWFFIINKFGGSIATIGKTGFGFNTRGDGPNPYDEVPESFPDGIPDCIQYLGGWIETHFFEVYNNSIDILGETYSETIKDYLNKFPINWEMNWKDHNQSSALANLKTVQEWMLLGDPSLKIGGYNI